MTRVTSEDLVAASLKNATFRKWCPLGHTEDRRRLLIIAPTNRVFAPDLLMAEFLETDECDQIRTVGGYLSDRVVEHVMFLVDKHQTNVIVQFRFADNHPLAYKPDNCNVWDCFALLHQSRHKQFDPFCTVLHRMCVKENRHIEVVQVMITQDGRLIETQKKVVGDWRNPPTQRQLTYAQVQAKFQPPYDEYGFSGSDKPKIIWLGCSDGKYTLPEILGQQLVDACDILELRYPGACTDDTTVSNLLRTLELARAGLVVVAPHSSWCGMYQHEREYSRWEPYRLSLTQHELRYSILQNILEDFCKELGLRTELCHLDVSRSGELTLLSSHICGG